MKFFICLILLTSIVWAVDDFCYKVKFERENCSGSASQLKIPGSANPAVLNGAHQPTQLSKSIENRLKKIEKQLRRLSRRSGRNEKEVEQIFAHLETNNLCLAGMKSGYIKDGQISASGYWQNKEEYSAKHARLDSQTGVGAWSAASFQKGHQSWVQVDLKTEIPIYGVVIEGRQTGLPQYVTHFKIQHGLTKEEMTSVSDAETGFPVIFTGNTDQFSHHAERFHEPITARYFRILPVDWHGHASMRFDLLTC